MTLIDFLINFLATYLILIFIPVFFWLLHKGDKITLYTTITSCLLAFILSRVIKDFYYLPRPFVTAGQLPLVDFRLDGSLPSSHTALSFAFSFPVLHRKRILGLFLVSLSVLIAFGRIAGGVHTLLDVMVGLIIAIISFLFSQKIFRG